MARPILPALVLLLLLVPVPTTAGAFRLGEALGPLTANPADALRTPVDEVSYDRATRCLRTARPGMTKFQRWLEAHAAGTAWGTYRCELWGGGQASLHAEGRALDWHLDASRPGDRAAARRLIRLLLAPDRSGEPHALARRMGVSEIIWDCSYWGAGMDEFSRYRVCFGKDGTPRRRIGKTVAHRDHLHFGLTKAGAMGRTTFWQRGR